MKKFMLFVLIALVALSVFVSCDDSNDNEPKYVAKLVFNQVTSTDTTFTNWVAGLTDKTAYVKEFAKYSAPEKVQQYSVTKLYFDEDCSQLADFSLFFGYDGPKDKIVIILTCDQTSQSWTSVFTTVTDLSSKFSLTTTTSISYKTVEFKAGSDCFGTVTLNLVNTPATVVINPVK